MYAATPNRLARQRSSESKSSTTSDDECEGVKNINSSSSDEVAVYCRLRPLGGNETEVNFIFRDFCLEENILITKNIG